MVSNADGLCREGKEGERGNYRHQSSGSLWGASSDAVVRTRIASGSVVEEEKGGQVGMGKHLECQMCFPCLGGCVRFPCALLPLRSPRSGAAPTEQERQGGLGIPQRGAGAALGAEWDPCWLGGTSDGAFHSSRFTFLSSNSVFQGTAVGVTSTPWEQRDQDEKWLQGCFRKGLI